MARRRRWGQSLPRRGCGSLVVRNFVEVLDQIFNAELLKLGAGDSVVHIGDIGAVMAIVVDFHCQCVDVWLERIKRISESRQCVCHFLRPPRMAARLARPQCLDSPRHAWSASRTSSVSQMAGFWEFFLTILCECYVL